MKLQSHARAHFYWQVHGSMVSDVYCMLEDKIDRDFYYTQFNRLLNEKLNK